LDRSDVSLALADNIVLYALFAILFGRMLPRTERLALWQRQATIGLAFGLAAFAGMLNPVNVVPGVFVDLRVVPVALAGLFGGPLAALVSVVPPGIYRGFLGGVGVSAGYAALVLSAALGLMAYAVRLHRGGEARLREVVLLGAALPLATFAGYFALPNGALIWRVFDDASLPIALAYPIGLILLGSLLIAEQQRNRLEQQLYEKNALLDSVLAHVPGMLFRRVLHDDGTPIYTYVSDGVRQLFGLEPVAVTKDGRRLLDAIHPGDRETLRGRLQSSSDAGHLPPFEYRTVLPDGTVRWLRGAATMHREGAATAWYGMVLDVTDARDVEEREHALAQIVRNVDTAIFRLDPEFRIVYANAAAERLYGCTAEAVIGKPGSMFRPPERVAHMRPFLERLMASRQPAGIETEALRTDGRRIPIELHVAPLFDRQDELTGWASITYDLSEQKALQAELARLASTDPLSGLANRRAFEESAARLLDRGRRHARPLAVVAADIDRFKQVNDRYGHSAGDAAIRTFARLVGGHLRSGGDVGARVGGEEFVVLLPDTAEAGGAALAERLRAAIEAQPIVHEGRGFRITVSFGVAEVERDDADIHAALSRADAALYRAKREGRNRVVTAGPTEPQDIRCASAGEG